jgi:hypothetical protein
MEIFIGIMSITGFIFWVLAFAWLVGFIAEKFGVYK